MTSVLIVEDDKSVARFLEQTSSEAGYSALVIGEGQAALKAVRERAFDMILLDVMLPGLNGFSVCRRLRAAGVAVPVLMLTAKDTLKDKIEGLDSGADDYIVKPFEVDELLARMRALLRRTIAGPAQLQVADLVLDTATRKASRAGKSISLSVTEYNLLEYLMRHVGQNLTRAMILDHVWQYDFDGVDNVLEVYISYLRAKIDKGHSVALIRTVRGVGYALGGPIKET